MTKTPTVSVVTISYNHEKFIRTALDSFLMQQTNFPFEIVIADDGSTDGTQKIIREYAKRHPDIIKPILREKNIGAVPNSLDSLRHARGKYIALCEGDDYWTDPEKLQRQVDFFESHPGYAVCFHPAGVVFEGKEEKSFTHPDASEKATFTVTGLVRRNYIHTSSVMYRRQSYDTMPDNILPLDWYLHLYHAQFGKIGFIERTMSAYRRHSTGIWWESYENADALLRNHGVKWLGLYVELRKLFKDHAERRKILEGAIITMFNNLEGIDKKYGSNLLSEALAAYPEDALLHIANLREQIAALRRHSDEQAKIIEHYVNLSKNLQDESRRLQDKKLIRLEHAVKSRIKRLRGSSR